MTKRQLPKDRKASVLNAAIEHAKEIGYLQITREGVAQRAGCSSALVSNYWGTMPQLRRAVMRAAITKREFKIILQGLAVDDPQALKAPIELQKAALNIP